MLKAYLKRKVFIFCLAVVFIFSIPLLTAGDERQKLKKIQEEIKTQEKKLKEIKRVESSTLDELERMTRQMINAENDLRKQKKLLTETESNISKVKDEISIITAKLTERKDWMRRKLRAMQKYGNLGDAILLIVASENVSQLIRRLQYLERLSEYEFKIIDGFNANIKVLADKERTLKELYSRQMRQESHIKRTLQDISEKKKQKETLLASIKREKGLYEQMLMELEESSKRLTEIIRRSEEEKEFVGEGFRALKGKLPWPVEGEVATPYGRQKDPKYNTTIFRNGINIKTSEGVSAKAIFNGQVVFADWFKGYGQLVIVNHGQGYHSLYANLSEIFLKVGAIIKRGSEIGRIGESIMVNAPSLYFEIRYKGRPLDPTQWLMTR